MTHGEPLVVHAEAPMEVLTNVGASHLSVLAATITGMADLLHIPLIGVLLNLFADELKQVRGPRKVALGPLRPEIPTWSPSRIMFALVYDDAGSLELRFAVPRRAVGEDPPRSVMWLAIDGTPGGSGMAAAPRVPADGEKLSTRQIEETHVPHPGVSEHFKRSTLLIGSRGVGKTFLLRHRKQTSHPGGIYINLVDTLHSIARDAGIGGRSLVFTEEQARRIRAKTAALIASRAIELCVREIGEAIALSLTLLDPLLPSDLRMPLPATSVSTKALRFAISTSSLSSWPAEDHTHILTDLLSELANVYPHKLTIFFDRAEDVSIPSLGVLMQLLDQSVEALVVIAARPGVAQLLQRDQDPTLIPGDHYDILHVGVNPYEDSWQNFVESATRNYLAANEIAIPEGLGLRWTCHMARDSIRQAVNFAQFAISTSTDVAFGQRITQMAAAREQLLRVVRQQLIPEHADFRNVIDHVHHHPRVSNRLSEGSPFYILLRVVGHSPQQSLLGEKDPLSDYVLRAMRGGALFYPPNHHWHPYELPGVFELAPLLAWDGRNDQWIK